MSWKKACRRIESRSVGLLVVLVEMLVNLGKPGWAGWSPKAMWRAAGEINGPGVDTLLAHHVFVEGSEDGPRTVQNV